MPRRAHSLSSTQGYSWTLEKWEGLSNFIESIWVEKNRDFHVWTFVNNVQQTSNITPNISRGLTTPFHERREMYSFCMPSSSASPERKALLAGVELEATQRSRQATQPLGHNGWGACPWKWRVYASVIQPSPSFPWMGLTQVHTPVHAVTWLSPARARAPKRASECGATRRDAHVSQCLRCTHF
ncbi:hypothetical protein FA13DRAFT_479404 [Coprinellus micaceus]|uniref:Uncharacterized protein n=1 Tax=Coprinellus micaceus TaxID=71717 RepID=A0A4Y7TBY0_COPMI|nr:hypothetical protein FA13DRAFT_479404 [Coprinellus micaceus]